MTYAPIQGKCPVCHHDSANTAFQAGAASRDAEVAELKQTCIDHVEIQNALREQVKILRGIVLKIDLTIDGSLSPQHYAWKREVEEVLAATEPTSTPTDI